MTNQLWQEKINYGGNPIFLSYITYKRQRLEKMMNKYEGRI
ncbi:hypothetical protein BSM4216_2133 [Bacillus smithii]|nr:hypothetical protein BSM4216_2133 [Bacillus smithii]